MPIPITSRSPNVAINRPQNGLATSLIRANAEITAPTWRLLTPKLRAKTGRTGTRTPKPTATQNAISPSTYTSRGRDRLLLHRIRNELRGFTAHSVALLSKSSLS